MLNSIKNMAIKTSIPEILAVLFIAVVLFTAVKEAMPYATLTEGKIIPVSNSCYDSDGGEFVGIKGSCSYVRGNFSDYCNDRGRIIEYICVPNDTCSHRSQSCRLGEMCVDGACVAK